jgi:hypothetical protein
MVIARQRCYAEVSRGCPSDCCGHLRGHRLLCTIRGGLPFGRWASEACLDRHDGGNRAPSRPGLVQSSAEHLRLSFQWLSWQLPDVSLAQDPKPPLWSRKIRDL